MALQNESSSKELRESSNSSNEDEQLKKFQRLYFLMEKSRIFTGILAEKLQRDRAKLNAKLKTLTASKNTRNEEQREQDVIDTSKIQQENINPEDGSVNSTTEPSASIQQPKLITGTKMRDYQLAGLEWLISLYENGLNGILADEMGLGKTLQTISLIAFLKSKGVNGPFLIAAPLSTISNWVKEIHKFAPKMSALLYHGSKIYREELREKHFREVVDENFPLIITSYEIVMMDKKFLRKYSWKYIIIDEGHRIKNLDCKLIKELKTYHSANRLLLTGTPLQNNLRELWSLLNFLLPDIFDDLDIFESYFEFGDSEDSSDHQKKLIGNMHAILKPFLLRRVKTDVDHTLSRKREYVLYAPMTETQNKVYQLVIDNRQKSTDYVFKIVSNTIDTMKRNTRGSKRKHIESPPQNSQRIRQSTNYSDHMSGFDNEKCQQDSLEDTEQRSSKVNKLASTSFSLSNLLMLLRKIANHPYLAYHPCYPNSSRLINDQRLMQASGKMLLLNRLLSTLFKDNHKVILFSQFTSMLDLIEIWAEDVKGWDICRIDGSMTQEMRTNEINRFGKNKHLKLFLLSTRAGGLGINLTSADTVIIFDPDWNPQQDLQAEDRCHRIGQSEPVLVFRFVTVNSVESLMMERANDKRKLERMVIQRGNFKSLLSSLANDDNNEAENSKHSHSSTKVVQNTTEKIISDGDLSLLLDRSKEAYDRFENGESIHSTSIDIQNHKNLANEDMLI